MFDRKIIAATELWATADKDIDILPLCCIHYRLLTIPPHHTTPTRPPNNFHKQICEKALVLLVLSASERNINNPNFIYYPRKTINTAPVSGGNAKTGGGGRCCKQNNSRKPSHITHSGSAFANEKRNVWESLRFLVGKGAHRKLSG